MDPKSSKRTTVPTFAEGDLPDESREPTTCLITMAGSNVGQMFYLSQDLVTIGRGDSADIQIVDGGISRTHATLRREGETGGYVFEDLGSSNGSQVNELEINSPCRLETGDKIQLGVNTVLRFSSSDEPETRYARKMYQAVLRDALTGVFNRRYLNQRMDSELAFAHRHRKPLAALFLDIDHFKRVNDHHHHLCGDAVLRQFAEVVGRTIRTEDVLARYGGEEFAILCRECNLDQARMMAERIRQAIQDHGFSYQELTLEVTVSIGVAVFDGNDLGQKELLLTAADTALLQAKEQGRNRVVVSP